MNHSSEPIIAEAIDIDLIHSATVAVGKNTPCKSSPTK